MKTTSSWLIRVASGPRAAGGHVGRCLALSQALQAHGQPVMVLDRDGADWQDTIKANGVDACVVGHEEKKGWTGCVMDGYNFGEDVARALVSMAAPLTVIDDFLQPPSCASLVVNSSPGLLGDSVGVIPALLGPRYALLRRSFWTMPARKAPYAARRMVICMGSVDSINMTGSVITAVARIATASQLERLTVVLGRQSPHIEAVGGMLDDICCPYQLIIDAPDLAQVYRSSDVAVGAGGVGLLERLAAGIPSISIALSDNQRRPIEGAQSAGATVAVERDAPQTVLREAIALLLADSGKRAEMAQRAQTLVDGRGAIRVAEAISKLVPVGTSH